MLDTAPLLSVATPAEVRAYRRGRGRFGGPPVRVRPCLGGVSYTTVMTGSGVLTAVLASVGADQRAVAVAALTTALSALGAFLCARATHARTCLREYRLAAFAARNGLVYERGAASPSVPGLSFTADGCAAGQALRRFRGQVAGRPVEAGNYRHADGTISGYVISGQRVEIVPPFDFAAADEWDRAWRLIAA
jgi:hypothetical protein